MKQKSCILAMVSLSVTCFALLSCDTRQERQQTEDAGSDVSVRTKREQRAVQRETTGSSASSVTPPEKMQVPPQSTDESIAEWAWSMMATRPDLVEKAIRELSPDSPEREALIRTYVLELLGRSPDEAITWANSLGDQKSIFAAREEIAMALPSEQIDLSVQLLLDPVRISRQGFDNSSARLLERWIGYEPETAAHWVIGLPTGESRDTGIRTLVTEWLQSDAEGALKWLSSQAAVSTRNEVSRAMAQAMVETDVAQREQLLETASPVLRQELDQQIQALLPPSPSVEPETQANDPNITE